METDTKPKPIVILVMGGPASGKGTYCKRLSEDFGLEHLSIGDILRSERTKPTEEGCQLDQFMTEFEQTGKLMSCETVAFFLFKEMKAVAGYHYWMDQINEKVDLKFVLYLECSAGTMFKRMKGRSETSGRLDDNEGIFGTRVNTFFKRTLPAIELLAVHGFVFVVGTEDEMEKVYAKVKEAFYKYFPDFKY